MLKRVDNNLLMKISKSDNKLCKKTSSKTIEEKKGFNILGPAELDANEKIYTDAINFALENKNIKNIAITGIYGAGKSSIWLTHIKKWNVEKKPIFISLGNYDVSVNPKSKTFKETLLFKISYINSSSNSQSSNSFIMRSLSISSTKFNHKTNSE